MGRKAPLGGLGGSRRRLRRDDCCNLQNLKEMKRSSQAVTGAGSGRLPRLRRLSRKRPFAITAA